MSTTIKGDGKAPFCPLFIIIIIYLFFFCKKFVHSCSSLLWVLFPLFTQKFPALFLDFFFPTPPQVSFIHPEYLSFPTPSRTWSGSTQSAGSSLHRASIIAQAKKRWKRCVWWLHHIVSQTRITLEGKEKKHRREKKERKTERDRENKIRHEICIEIATEIALY